VFVKAAILFVAEQILFLTSWVRKYAVKNICSQQKHVAGIGFAMQVGRSRSHHLGSAEEP
jgi:hypothetical protein